MAKLYNLARVSTATAGTGTITLGAAVTGHLTFALAGVQDGDQVYYAINDGANSEVGVGTYTASGTTLTRGPTKSTNSDAAISLSGTAEVFITYLAESTRELLTGNRTYYVRTDGSNSNTGLANTSGGAWLTIQHAVNEISQKLDLSLGFVATIQVGAGTYDEHVTLRGLTGAKLSGAVLQGDTTTPTNVIIKPTTGLKTYVVGASGIGPGWVVQGFHIDGTDAGFGGWQTVDVTSAFMELYNCRCSMPNNDGWFPIYVYQNATLISANLSFSISGSQSNIYLIQHASYVAIGGTITLAAGTPVFDNAWVEVDQDCLATFSCTFSGWGAATGRRAFLFRGSALAITDTAANAIPGDVDVYVDGSSVYNGSLGSIKSDLNLALPTTTQLPIPGTGALIEDTDGRAYVAYNDGGTIKSVELLATPQLKLTADTTFYVRTVPATITVTIATPAVVSWTSHGLSVDDPVVFATSGALPTGMTAGTIYYVISAGFGANSFQISTSVGGAAVNTSGSQSGTHKGQTGNNLNNGQAQTRTGAWLTIQAAFNWLAANVDAAGFSVIVQLADGVYSSASLDNVPTQCVEFTLQGNNTTPANVIVNYDEDTNYCCLLLQSPQRVPIHIYNMEFRAANYYSAIIGYTPVDLGVSKLRFVSNTDGGDCIGLYGSYSTLNIGYPGKAIYIQGNWSDLTYIETYGQVVLYYQTVFTFSGTPLWDYAFVALADHSNLTCGSSVSFSGSTTGPRVDASRHCVIRTNSGTPGNLEFFPGNASPVLGVGATYDNHMVGPATKIMTASEAITAKNLINIHDSSGGKVRKADADGGIAQQADGYAPFAISNGAIGLVELGEGIITGLSSLTVAARYFLSATAGGVTATAPSTTGQVMQPVGVALSTTELAFKPRDGVVVA